MATNQGDAPPPDVAIGVREAGRAVTPDPAWPPSEAVEVRGIVRLVRDVVGDDRRAAVAIAAAAARAVLPLYIGEGDEAPAERGWLEAQLGAAEGWVDDPSDANVDFAFGHFDPTRQVHAWQGFDALPETWVLEACEYAVLAAWTGVRRGYVSYPGAAEVAGRAVASAYLALRASTAPEDEAIERVARASGLIKKA